MPTGSHAVKASFVEVAGARTRLLLAGSGAPLLLLHGLGTTADRWVRNIDALSAECAVVAPDLLGAGFSADPATCEAPPQAQHVRHLEALVDHLGFAEYAVAGSSYGGLLAALLQLRNPARVSRLVIVGSGSALHPPKAQRQTLQSASANGTRAFEDGTLQATRARMESLMFDPASTPSETLLLQLVANAQPGRAQAMQRIYAGLLACVDSDGWQAYPHLEKISAPTLIVTGREDPRASWELAQMAGKRIPHCTTVVYGQCGHAPMIEHAERFNRDILHFLGSSRGQA